MLLLFFLFFILFFLTFEDQRITLDLHVFYFLNSSMTIFEKDNNFWVREKSAVIADETITPPLPREPEEVSMRI